MPNSFLGNQRRGPDRWTQRPSRHQRADCRSARIWIGQVGRQAVSGILVFACIFSLPPYDENACTTLSLTVLIIFHYLRYGGYAKRMRYR